MQATVANRRRNAYGVAQADFLKRTRDAIKQDSKFFKHHDWTRIQYKPGYRNSCFERSSKDVLTVESFYVKDLAMWIPDMIIKGHMPTCPNCAKSEFVAPTGTFCGRPKLLYGLRTHRYLDSKYYKCHSGKCKGSTFSGCNEKSLQLDATKILGIFNFHLTAGCAVDDELYSYITNHSKDTTASIYKRVALMTLDQWISDAMLYYAAVRAERVAKPRADALPSQPKQSTIDKHLVIMNKTPAQKK